MKDFCKLREKNATETDKSTMRTPKVIIFFLIVIIPPEKDFPKLPLNDVENLLLMSALTSLFYPIFSFLCKKSLQRCIKESLSFSACSIKGFFSILPKTIFCSFSFRYVIVLK